MTRNVWAIAAAAGALAVGLATVSQGSTLNTDTARICRTKEPSPPGPDDPKPKPKLQGSVLSV